MLTDTQMRKIKKRISHNNRFKRRIEWYTLGQRRCHCCGVQMNWTGDFKNSATVEHLVPHSKGGTMHAENIIILCRTCNNTRADYDWIEWVTKNNIAKSDWLIAKYINAVEFYRTHNVKVHISIFHKVREYKNKIKKQQELAA